MLSQAQLDYHKFLGAKIIETPDAGFDIDPQSINPRLFRFQRDIVRWALKKGRAALFEETGLGKTIQFLAWGEGVHRHTGGKILILCPLAVAHQTIREAERFGFPAVRYCRSQEDADAAPEFLIITNYDIVKAFDPQRFAGVVLDESSILKNFTGKTKNLLQAMFKDTPFRLCCTATPAPNDQLEFGNHSEFLGWMDSNKMISRWFINDTMAAGSYRLKKPSRKDFWRWMTSWAVCISKPSDLGPEYADEDALYDLPELVFHTEIVGVDYSRAIAVGRLIPEDAPSATSMWKEKKATLEDRCQRAKDIIGNDDGHWIIWCDTDAEADRLKLHFPDAVEVRGSHTRTYKINAAQWFTGNICKCQLKANGNSEEIAWQGQDTTKSTTRSTETKDSPVQLNGSEKTPNVNAPTGLNITPSIENEFLSNSEKSEMLQEKSGMRVGENNTHLDLTLENQPSGMQKSGQRTTRKKPLPKISGSSDLRQSNTENSSLLRMGSAQYAGESMLTEGDTDSTLITITEPGKSGACSAEVAITESGSLETIPSDSNARRCTCGSTDSMRRILISKTEVYGWGLNFQHCHSQVFVGVSYSFEKLYQGLRRSWRFGQTKPVHAWIIYAETEGNIMQTIKDKQKQHSEMIEEMAGAQAANGLVGINRSRLGAKIEVQNDVAAGKNWTLYLGDCVERTKEILDNSVDLSIFSPPFSQLYVYTDVPQDMGNNEGDDEFFQHFGYLIPELHRITKPGRLCVVHSKDLPMYKNRDGSAGLRDFPGMIVRAFEDAGWTYHSRVTIWKDPVIEMQRTKNHGLLWRNFTERGEACRQGMPDYLVVFRKWTDDMPDKQVQHHPTPGEYIGTEPPKHWDSNRDYSIQVWQKYASPVWFDIRQTNVLNIRQARSEDDEKHICPLQLDVIARCVELWSNPGEVVFSPFAGIGSEGYQSLKMNRRFVGIELKREYWTWAQRYLAEAEQSTFTLFDMAGISLDQTAPAD